MATFIKQFSRLFIIASVGISLAASAADAPVAGNQSAHADAKQDWTKHRQEWIKHVTDRMAERLEIKASQQSAFQAYAKTLESAFELPGVKTENKTDAASIARLHAEIAAVRAQKLAQVADATAKLQEVLSPDQRKTLDQIVAHAAHRHMGRFHGGFDGMRGEHGGEGWGHDKEMGHGGHWDRSHDDRETQHN